MITSQPTESLLATTPGARVIRQGLVTGDVEIVGQRYTVLQKTLEPGETYLAESGSMMHMSNGVTMRAYFGGLAGIAQNVLSGEDIARVRFTNSSQQVGYVGITPNQPMSIVVPLNLDAYGGSMNAKRGAYIAGPETIAPQVQILPARSCLACCCGGLPPVIQSLHGSGIGFIAAGGTVVQKSLGPGERILVDTDSVLAFTNTIHYDVKRVGNCVTCCCAGEGCFNTLLTGPGDVFIQSMPYEKLLAFIVSPASAPSGTDNKDGGGKKHHDGGHHHGHHH